ncbi:MAG: CoA pyrophosphatase [Halioglobus sp.]|nr:CoA pyrophosphatase [Halioglobus sp.]
MRGTLATMLKNLEQDRHSLQVRRHIRRNLERFEVRPQPLADLRSAAVTLPVSAVHGEPALIITRRVGGLRAHSGQWALPGGRVDRGETPEQAALRELREEINLHLPPRSVLGRLDDYVTRSGYRITPVVVWCGMQPSELRPNPQEVASIHYIRFSELARDDAPVTESIPQSDRPVLSMRLDADRIYAPTAALLYQFREVIIRGEPTRVHHFDQPLFAWR